jgi:hypothetical protein
MMMMYPVLLLLHHLDYSRFLLVTIAMLLNHFVSLGDGLDWIKVGLLELVPPTLWHPEKEETPILYWILKP